MKFPKHIEFPSIKITYFEIKIHSLIQKNIAPTRLKFLSAPFYSLQAHNYSK
jgi:hypothetical protein